MIRITLSLCGLVLVGSALVGCEANPSGRTPIVRTPLASTSTPTPVGERGDPEIIDPAYVQWSGSGGLESNTEIVTDDSLRFMFLAPNTSYGTTYRALVGREASSAEPAICQVVPPAMEATPAVQTADPTTQPAAPPEETDVSYGMLQGDVVMGATPNFRIFAGSGYVLFNGARPHGETGGGEVTSDGATVIIVRPGKTADRFFLLYADAGRSMTVKALLGFKQTKTVTQLLRYVDVERNGTIGPVKPIPLVPSDPTFQFVSEVVMAGIEAGFAAPQNWPPPLQEPSVEK